MRLKVASYNIRKAMGLDRRRDPARILARAGDAGGDEAFLLRPCQKRLPQPFQPVSACVVQMP